MVDIPVLDVASIMAENHKDALIDDLRTAYGEIGFAYITGHGVDRALIDAVFDANHAFHALPLEEKLALKVDRTHRGYIPIDSSTDRTSTLAVVTKPNQSASFMIMRDDPKLDPAIYLSGPNRWPDIPGFKEIITEYQTRVSYVARALMPAMLRAAGVSDHTILQAFDTPTTWLRLLHYPPTPPTAPDDLYGSAPHTDFGALTLLAQDPIGGLQVKTATNHWIDAPYNADAFVMNVGDMLHRLTNGRLMSTPHRVINRSGRERFSVPFFYDPHVHTTIAPLPGTGTPKFRPQRFDAFLRTELEASYDAHQPDTP